MNEITLGLDAAVEALVDNFQLTYSTVDKKYQANELLNYRAYTSTELCNLAEITEPAARKEFKKLLSKYATSIDSRLPDMNIQACAEPGRLS